MSTTTIEWTDIVWNPTTGCDRVSPGCDNCYALTMAKRLKSMGAEKYQKDGDPRTSGPGFGITMHEAGLAAPFRWRKPRKVFVNSMSDLFHGGVTVEFIAQVFAVMALTPQHQYQVLTKRARRMRRMLNGTYFQDRVAANIERIAATRNVISFARIPNALNGPLPNVWLGVSAENQKYADLRIAELRRTPAAIRFASAEPLLGPINLTAHLVPNAMACWTPAHVPGRDDKRALSVITRAGARMLGGHYLDWVIVGGESGPNARPVDPAWIRSLRDQCDLAAVPFLFKQWGGRTPKAGGRELDGRTWDEYPERAA